MIRRTLERLEAEPDRELQRGLDAAGDVAWSLRGRDLLERAGGWQTRLAELGATRGDRVALDAARGPDLLAAHLAVLAQGCTLVPLNPALAQAERQRVLERAEVKAVLGRNERPSGGGTVALAEYASGVPALLIFTSGTTGEPKGVPLTEGNIEANLAALQQAWGITSEDRLLHALPAHHVHGLVLALYGSARAGVCITWLERFDAELCLRALEDQGITLFMGVPTMFHRMIEAETRSSLDAMRLCVSGSAPLEPRDFSRFNARFGHQPLERYGLTETLIVSTNPLREERRPGTVGMPVPGTQVRLDSDGEVLVRGPGVMSGYWRAADTSNESFTPDGFFRTGDLGRLDEAGYLVITGRKKELIIVGGSNVLPGEVEAALTGDAQVDELAVAGMPDADRGEVVAVFVVARADADATKVETRLREAAEATLAPYKRPRLYRFIPALPRNAMGKIDRQSLTRP